VIVFAEPGGSRPKSKTISPPCGQVGCGFGPQGFLPAFGAGADGCIVSTFLLALTPAASLGRRTFFGS
jgi:hypothetical protein